MAPSGSNCTSLNSPGFAREMLQRAKAAGYKAIIVTADVDVTSNRERSLRLQGAAIPNLKMGNPENAGRKSWQCHEYERRHGVERYRVLPQGVRASGRH